MGQRFLLESTQALQHSTTKHEGTRIHEKFNQELRWTFVIARTNHSHFQQKKFGTKMTAASIT